MKMPTHVVDEIYKDLVPDKETGKDVFKSHVVGKVHPETKKLLKPEEVQAIIDFRNILKHSVFYCDDILLDESAESDDTRDISICHHRRLFHDIKENLGYLFRDFVDNTYSDSPTSRHEYDMIQQAYDRIENGGE